MHIDHSEFIKRHHKNAETDIRNVKKSATLGPVHMFVIILALMAVLMAYFMVSMAMLDRLTVIIAISGFLFFALLGGLALRSYTSYQKQFSKLGLLSEVLQGSRGARLITDEKDQAVYTNKKFETLCKGIGAPGYKTLLKLFENNDDALAHFRLLADQAHRGLTDSVELFSRREDRERWFQVTAQPVADWSGFIHWRVDDVTQKHIVDRAIREEREKLIDFTDNAPVGFFSVDERGRFVFANATFARWVGEDLQRLLHEGTLHTYLVEPPQNARPYDLAEDAGVRQVLEIKMKGPAGRTFLASINQTIVKEEDGRVRTRAVVHDLTSEKEMRQALKASEDRFQRFFDEAPLGILLVDENGVIQDCNGAFAAMLGKDVQEIERHNFYDHLTDEKSAAVKSAIESIEQGQRMTAPMEVTLQDGESQIETQMHAQRFKDSDNIVLHFIDRREQKALEAQFTQSQKMQAIGQLAGGVAHDFNNLLTAMVGFCDLLLLRHKPGDPSFADIMQIKQNSNRASNLVRQLLAFSRQQTLRPKVQDVGDILTEVSHLIRRLIGANVELDVVHGEDLGLVKVDEGQMEQVFINLAVNARDAILENDQNGGALTITTRNFTNRKAKELVSEELPPGHWTVIEVQDTGCGIPKENLSRIFDPFFTTKEVGQGTGLGLSTVYGIIRQTDGYLDVQSKIGKGTAFVIYLPRATEIEEDETAESAAEEEKQRDLTGTERIMLVEDEEAVRAFSTRALANKGYEVVAAEDGESALELWNGMDNKTLDLVISDVVMPGMDGPTLVQRIRQDAPKLKVIFVSGYTEDRLKDHMGEGIHFLAKPFSLKQLAAKVKEVLEG